MRFRFIEARRADGPITILCAISTARHARRPTEKALSLGLYFKTVQRWKHRAGAVLVRGDPGAGLALRHGNLDF